jgi:uncharacterized protein
MAHPPVTGTCWLDPRVEVRPSPIGGGGLFATADLAEGTVVARLGGRLVATADLAALIAAADADPTAPYVDTITVEDDLHLVIPPGSPIHFGNHRCDPNLWHTDAFTLVARRSIAVDEELTVDYATQTGVSPWRMDCRCGDPACRRVISGEDWRLPELQHRYGDHWVPGLLRRIGLDEA